MSLYLDQQERITQDAVKQINDILLKSIYTVENWANEPVWKTVKLKESDNLTQVLERYGKQTHFINFLYVTTMDGSIIAANSQGKDGTVNPLKLQSTSPIVVKDLLGEDHQVAIGHWTFYGDAKKQFVFIPLIVPLFDDQDTVNGAFVGLVNWEEVFRNLKLAQQKLVDNNFKSAGIAIVDIKSKTVLGSYGNTTIFQHLDWKIFSDEKPLHKVTDGYATSSKLSF